MTENLKQELIKHIKEIKAGNYPICADDPNVVKLVEHYLVEYIKKFGSITDKEVGEFLK